MLWQVTKALWSLAAAVVSVRAAPEVVLSRSELQSCIMALNALRDLLVICHGCHESKPYHIQAKRRDYGGVLSDSNAHQEQGGLK